MFTSLRRAFSELRRLGVKAFAILTAVQVFLVGVLVAMDELRKRRQGPREGFSWVEGPEVELESGETRLKLHPYGVRLYETMLEEVARAEEEIFVGTFIWKGRGGESLRGGAREEGS